MYQTQPPEELYVATVECGSLLGKGQEAMVRQYIPCPQQVRLRILSVVPETIADIDGLCAVALTHSTQLASVLNHGFSALNSVQTALLTANWSACMQHPPLVKSGSFGEQIPIRICSLSHTLHLLLTCWAFKHLCLLPGTLAYRPWSSC